VSIKTKTNRGNFFEDFKVGQKFQHATPRTISSGDASTYIALTGSRFLLHSSTEAAKQCGFNNQLIDNLLVFHIAFGKTVADISLNAVANLGYSDVRFLAAVYEADTLSVASEVIGLKQNSHGRSGIVYVHSVATNQNGTEVLCWNRWVMVSKANLESPEPQTVVPEMPKFVAPEKLPIIDELNFGNFSARDSGSECLWGDYQIGEKIDHGNGMTIDNTEHTMATKLYQNNARVHFDEIYMNHSNFRRRLMYGGHVISICRALSHNGLGNGLLIAAINGGIHSAPTFAGDTIYAFSEVIDKWEIKARNDVAAIRVKTWGVKNQSAEKTQNPYATVEGEVMLKPEIVLELDYTLLMPR